MAIDALANGPAPSGVPGEAKPEPIEPLPFALEERPHERPRVAVVVPVYDEARILERTSSELAEALDGLQVDWRVLFVNDGSRDETTRVMETIHGADGRFEYLLLSRNFGHQAALSAGLDHADGDVIISMDADLQHPPVLLRSMMAAWRKGFDVVHTRKLATVGLPRWRRALTDLAYSLVARLAGIAIIPQASDYRLLDARAHAALRALPEVARLHRGLAVWIGFRQCVLPYTAPERVGGASHYSFRQLVTLFARALLDFSDAFLYAGLLLGSLGLLLSAAYIAFILTWLLFGRSTPPGWASSISVTMLLNSIVLLFLGILGVYVARIYREVRRRPAYVVSFVRRSAERPPDRT